MNRKVSLLAVFVLLLGCALQAIASLLILAPLIVLEGAGSSSAFSPGQSQALAHLLAVAAPRELSLLVWLLVKGVDARRWKQEAGVLRSGPAEVSPAREARERRRPDGGQG